MEDEFEGDQNNRNNDEDESLVTGSIERVQREQEEGHAGGEYQQQDDEVEVWFDKVKPLVDHFREVSFSMIFILGTLLSFDEMMIRFFGRSVETHKMKNKPITCGYKFFVLSIICGFVINFTPDGRRAEKNGTQEYTKDGEKGKIETMILHVIRIIDRFRQRQKDRMSTYQRSTRSNGNESYDETIMNKFIVAMDNYFTLPNVMKKLRELDIGVVGTSRFKKNWPPKELKALTMEGTNFNEFHYCYDEHGTLLARWMDNSLVFCVSTVHQIGSVIKRMRKRPRKTAANKRHVSKVWGELGKIEIKIPTLIDDYNHWMGGVDVVDQLIAYYHPNARCRRTWIPMFLQIVSMVRCNAITVYKDHCTKNKQKKLSHKDFTLSMIDVLLKKAKRHSSICGKRTAFTENHPLTKPNVKKRRHLCLDSFDEAWPIRLQPNHQRLPVKGTIRGSCIQCCKKKLLDKKRGIVDEIQWSKGMGRTGYACFECTQANPDDTTCFLCKECFKQFHGY